MSLHNTELGLNTSAEPATNNYLKLPVVSNGLLPPNSPISNTPPYSSPYHTKLPSLKDIVGPTIPSGVPQRRRGSVSEYYLNTPISLAKSSPASPKSSQNSISIPSTFKPYNSLMNESSLNKNLLTQRGGRRNRSFSVVETTMFNPFHDNSRLLKTSSPNFETNSNLTSLNQSHIQLSLLNGHYQKAVNQTLIQSCHDPNDRFNCLECKASFSRKNSLKRHLFTHTSQRPYVCHACNKSFYRADIYNRHLKSKRCQRSREIANIIMRDNLIYSPTTIIEE
ncbi:hypothetical protein K502DRAFT_325021 [Neoconidiobolus thromboides FSU 785]|nr:hypothetical protein K502DRAFT_325021 [Neoconidiobolus thromboides FSU 785]